MSNLRDNKMDEIKTFFDDRLQEMKDYDQDDLDVKIRDGELHHAIFNTDYYIIGTYKAKQWLGVDAFDAIAMIKDYELDNFGEVYTDLSNAERVVNMVVYIIGEEIVADFVESLVC
jgi:hypothetical protein